MEIALQTTNQYIPVPKTVDIPASSDNKCTPSNDQNIVLQTNPCYLYRLYRSDLLMNICLFSSVVSLRG